MQDPITRNIGDPEAFQKYLEPFVAKANELTIKRFKVVDDGNDVGQMLMLKLTPVFILPWTKEDWWPAFTTSLSHSFRASHRKVLYVSSNNNVYIEHIREVLEFDTPWYSKRARNFRRDISKTAVLYSPNTNNVRQFFLEMKQAKMIMNNAELKNMLIKDG